MTGKKKITALCCVFLMGLLGLCSCGSPSSNPAENSATEELVGQDASGRTEELGGQGASGRTEESGGQGASDRTEESGGQDTSGRTEDENGSGQELVYTGSMELAYAENFSVDYYEGGYQMLSTMDGTRILVIPEGKGTPDGLDEDVIIMRQPVTGLYLVASAVMDMFDQLDALDCIRFSGQKEDGWYIESAKEAMAAGDLLYAGKYSKPDYELLVSENCSLAIENSMITHSPEVIEMLESFDIPSVIEYSSYEKHPLGRVEWIKFFGALVGKEEEADRLFSSQVALLDEVTADEKTGRTVAFFFVTSNGLIQVRQSSDYIPKMIELAGGKYVFEDLGDGQSARSTLNIQVEEFYDGAKDADFLIYNSSIDGGVQSIDELLGKCEVLEDFKAVQEGNVWCTTNDMYQQSMSIGAMTKDIHAMLQGESEDGMTYLFQLE